jgi:membrane-bound lytic murein transglycosylase D
MPDANQTVSGAPEKGKPMQSASDNRAALQKKTDLKGAGERQAVLQEADEEGQEMSLFVIKDDGEEEDLTSLLTADYLRQFDIPIVFNDAVQYFVRYFTTEKRKIMTNWLKRSRRYVPMIKEILREQGLPEDLIYLAMIESGFNPKAYSPMKACGPWQFVYETGGRYGLKVTHWVDERRDPEKSTVAAALYLKDLFNQFGNWYLAAAGFNAGEKRIERAVERHETSDFWELSKYNTLPRETREYIPRLLAAALIAKEPERFGFTSIDYDQPVQFISEKVPGATPLTVLAKAASTDVMKLKALNPELLTGITPPDANDYSIKLPEWVNKDKFREDLKAALENEERVEQVITYTCKRRDTLSSVMKMCKVTYSDLLLVNRCDQTLVAKRGSVIYIPKFFRETGPTETASTAAIQEAAPEAKREPQPEGFAESRPVHVNPLKAARIASRAARIASRAARIASRAAPGRHSDFHIVKKGERLADISEKYGIDLATLKEINKRKLKKNQIYPNMRLELTAARFRKTENIARPAVYHPSRKHETLVGRAVRYDTAGNSLKEKSRSSNKGKARFGAKSKMRSGKAIRATRG